MIRDELQRRLRDAVDRLVDSGDLPAGLPEIEVAEPKSPEHGDYATTFALAAAKAAGLNPRTIAEKLVGALRRDGLVARAEIAGPGFVNFRIEPSAFGRGVSWALERGSSLARSAADKPLKINVEFVSVNPNGPITVGSGRGAAFGSTLCRVLEAAGHAVHREYYINDGVNSEQMRMFAESVRCLALGQPLPERAYRGDYVQAVADELTGAGPERDVDWFKSHSEKLMIERQRRDLEEFDVVFDTWFSEQSLHDSGKVAEEIDALARAGIADERPERTALKLAKGGRIEDVEFQPQTGDVDDEGRVAESAASTDAGATLWLRSTKLGDDMDRVLRRRDGRLTYIASDVAYHKDKFNRGTRPEPGAEPQRADRLLTILGPDHHGYIGRLTAVVAAMLLSEGLVPEFEPDPRPLDEVESRLYRSAEERDRCRAALAEARRRLEVVIFQIVRFVKDGKPAPMRKRDGNIYALRDLVEEIGRNAAPNADRTEQTRIGKDVARFFYLMRSHETAMDFDLDLAEKQSEDNPVYYVQYAHARICSILERAREAGFEPAGAGEVDPERIGHPRESALIKKILDLPYEVRRCAEDYGVHRLTTYALELARLFHLFYGECRVIQPDDPEQTQSRLALCVAARQALVAVFELLGISAPQRMERESEAVS
ncbi:MAG: arginine--tRNA ligase [Fimbriimonadaceae bacterium]